MRDCMSAIFPFVVTMIGVMVPAVVMETFGTVKSHDDQTERIESGDEHAGEHREVRETRPRQFRKMHRLDNGILREEPANPGMPALEIAPISVVQ